MENAPWTRSWCDTLETASTGFGKTLNVGRFHKQWMEEAGFVDVEERVVKVSVAHDSETVLSNILIYFSVLCEYLRGFDHSRLLPLLIPSTHLRYRKLTSIAEDFGLKTRI